MSARTGCTVVASCRCAAWALIRACWAELWLGNDVQDNFQPHACALSRNRSKSSSVPNQRMDGAIISHVVTEIGRSRPAATTESSCQIALSRSPILPVAPLATGNGRPSLAGFTDSNFVDHSARSRQSFLLKKNESPHSVQNLDRSSLRPFRTLSDLHSHTLTLHESAQLTATERRRVDEHIFTAALLHNESKSLFGIVPFDRTDAFLGRPLPGLPWEEERGARRRVR